MARIMAIGKNNRRGKAQAAPPEKPQAPPPEETRSRKERVKDLLLRMEASLGQKADKATMGDLIRLIQFEREMEEDEHPGKVVVSWKEPPEIQDVET